MKTCALCVLLVLGGCWMASAQDVSPKSEINRKTLEARMKELENGLRNAQERLAQAQADVNAYDGAMQECRHWMEFLAKAEKEAKKEAEAVKKENKPDGIPVPGIPQSDVRPGRADGKGEQR